MEPSIWKVICISYLVFDIVASAFHSWAMVKRGEWNATMTCMAVGGLGGEIIVLLYVLGVIR